MRLGIDLGGTKTEIIALDDAGAQRYRKRVDTDPTNYDAIVGAIVRLVTDAEAELGAKGTVGVGIPGTISAHTGRVKNANTNVLNDRPLDQDLSRLLNREVRCMNDANCLALSEAVDGAAAGYRVVFAAILGTGCGAGVAIDGRPWAGPNLVAGEWGHNPLPWMTPDEYPGRPCWCGKHSCIEKWISGTGFANDYARALTGAPPHQPRGASPRSEPQTRQSVSSHEPDASAFRLIPEPSIPHQPPGASPRSLNAPQIVALSRHGDATARAALDRYANRLARCLAHVINILDPDAIVLGGGMSNVDELYDMVPAQLPDYVFGHEASTLILRNHHGDSSGVRGAAWLWQM
jgi:fructokinase